MSFRTTSESGAAIQGQTAAPIYDDWYPALFGRTILSLVDSADTMDSDPD